MTFGGEDRAAAKWMLGALPGIKLMTLTAASGHRDTDAASEGSLSPGRLQARLRLRLIFIPCSAAVPRISSRRGDATSPGLRVFAA